MDREGNFLPQLSHKQICSSSSSSFSSLRSLKIGAAARVVGGRNTLPTGFRIMFCWKREGEVVEMLVGDCGVVGEVDGLVTGSPSVLEW